MRSLLIRIETVHGRPLLAEAIALADQHEQTRQRREDTKVIQRSFRERAR